MVLTLKDEIFGGAFPFVPHYATIHGFQMHYVDEGSGDPIVCVHGEPTWGFLYRHVITGLSDIARVVVPDHMGFGKSEVPQDKPYRLEQHVQNLTELLMQLDLKNITLVVQDWGGPIGFGFATRHPDRIKRIVIMNTSVAVAKESMKLWFEPFVEKGMYDDLLGDMKTFVGDYMLPTIHKKLSREEKRLLKWAYTAPFPTPEAHIGAKAFPLDIPKGPTHPSTASMQEFRDNLGRLNEQPKILLWGMLDTIFPPKVMDYWEKIYSGIKRIELAEAGHFLQEDAPEKVVQAIRDFILADN
jgi:haloalkane dehalogenase